MTGSGSRAQLLVQCGDGAQAAIETVDGDPLVGSMSVFSGQPEPQQEYRRFQHAFEIADHGDGSALADDDGVLPECGAQCATRGVVEWAAELGLPGLSAVDVRYFHLHALWRNALHVRAKQLPDLRGILIRDQAATHLGHGTRWQHRLGAFARVPAQQSVDLAGGPRPDALECSETQLSTE